MDILSIGGIVLAVVAILGGQMLEGGHPSSILQATAFIIVMGGTVGAVMVNYPMAIFLKALGNARLVFFHVHIDWKATIAKIVELANLSRKQGLLALEEQIKTMTDPFLKKGVQLVVDGTEAKMIREILDVEVEVFEEENNLTGKVYESLGGYSPTVGILGAVLGLIHVMENLADPSKLGSGIATAFVATIYGVGAANLFFLPMGGKIKLKTKEIVLSRMMIIEGLVSLAQAENPKMIGEKLAGYLPESQRTKTK